MSHEVQSMKIVGAFFMMLFCEHTELPERRRNKAAAPRHSGRFIIVPLDLMMGGENVEYNNDKATEVQLWVLAQFPFNVTLNLFQGPKTKEIRCRNKFGMTK